MKVKIDLLYFDGCPNVDKARDHLKKALAQLSLPIKWNEIDVEDPNTQAHLKGFPSPTISVGMLIGASIWNLVNKKNIFKKQEECSSCKT